MTGPNLNISIQQIEDHDSADTDTQLQGRGQGVQRNAHNVILLFQDALVRREDWTATAPGRHFLISRHPPARQTA